MMNVVIRTDASAFIGTGHLMRCLTLADYLRNAGASVTFVSREHPGHLCDLVETRGYQVIRFPASEPKTLSVGKDDYAAWLAVPWQLDAEQTSAAIRTLGLTPDWLVVDHYGLDGQWELGLRALVGKIMVIDDLANRPHDCDLLLDQNFYLDLESRYDTFVSSRCRKLLGPGYVLLRPEFLCARRNLRPRDGRVKRVFVFYGGCDATGETAKTLRAILKLRPEGVHFDVILGASNPDVHPIQQMVAEWDALHCYIHVTRMAEMMSRADLALGGGGVTTWERCFLGLPSMVIEVADNQRVTLQALTHEGAIWRLGRHDEVLEEHLVEALRRVLNDPDEVRNVSRNAMRIMSKRSVEDECPVTRTLFELR
jgi:UDP-2,4-diacetamido-2,4,6-trideoxy-beta-L-altropyranose hydrolase